MNDVFIITQSNFFFFSSHENKNYLKPPRSPLDIRVVLCYINHCQLRSNGCIRPTKETKTAEGMTLCQTEVATTKGQRSVANRSIHNPTAWYQPTSIGTRMSNPSQNIDCDLIEEAFSSSGRIVS